MSFFSLQQRKMDEIRNEAWQIWTHIIQMSTTTHSVITCGLTARLWTLSVRIIFIIITIVINTTVITNIISLSPSWSPSLVITDIISIITTTIITQKKTPPPAPASPPLHSHYPQLRYPWARHLTVAKMAICHINFTIIFTFITIIITTTVIIITIIWSPSCSPLSWKLWPASSSPTLHIIIIFNTGERWTKSKLLHDQIWIPHEHLESSIWINIKAIFL